MTTRLKDSPVHAEHQQVGVFDAELILHPIEDRPALFVVAHLPARAGWSSLFRPESLPNAVQPPG